MPPTTIGRRPAASAASISSCASAANRPAENVSVTATNETSRCSSRSCSAGVATPVSTSRPRYTWSASAEIATGSSPSARSRSASSIATDVFPTPVGPKIAMTASGAATIASNTGWTHAWTAGSTAVAASSIC